MKTILALLFLICITGTYQFNSPDYDMGFYAMFGFDPNTDGEVYDCLQGFSRLYDNALEVFHATHYGGEQVFFATTKLIGDITKNIYSDCQDFKNALIIYVQQNAVIPPGLTLKETMISNAKLYYPDLIQDFTQWIQYLESGQDYLAGQTQAVVFQILIGAYVPYYPLPPQSNVSNVPFNASEFFPIFYETLFNGSNVTNQTEINSFIQCSLQISNIVMYAIQAKEQLDAGDGNRFMILMQAASDIYDAYGGCQESYEFGKDLATPLLQAFIKSPFKPLERLALNILGNLPDIIYEQKELKIYIEQGEYALAGEVSAEQQDTIFQGMLSY